MRIRTIIISVSLALSLSNCMSYDFSRRIVQQGNLLTPEKMSRLQIGMSKNDNKFIHKYFQQRAS